MPQREQHHNHQLLEEDLPLAAQVAVPLCGDHARGPQIPKPMRRGLAGQDFVTSESVTELDDLAQLAAFADAIYADYWIRPKITSSA